MSFIPTLNIRQGRNGVSLSNIRWHFYHSLFFPIPHIESKQDGGLTAADSSACHFSCHFNAIKLACFPFWEERMFFECQEIRNRSVLNPNSHCTRDECGVAPRPRIHRTVFLPASCFLTASKKRILQPRKERPHRSYIIKLGLMMLYFHSS